MYFAQVISGELVIEECDLTNSCIGTFISDDGTLRREGCAARRRGAGAERVAGWLEFAEGDELHTEERWDAGARGCISAWAGAGPAYYVVGGGLWRLRQRRRDG